MTFQNIPRRSFSRAVNIIKAHVRPMKQSVKNTDFLTAGCITRGRNKHHFEYWTDYDLRTKLMTPVKMPLKYVKEMFCDRVAASKIYMKDKYDDGAPLAYFLRAKKTRAIHPETSDLLEKLLTMLRDKGEDYTFAYIRRLKKY